MSETTPNPSAENREEIAPEPSDERAGEPTELFDVLTFLSPLLLAARSFFGLVSAMGIELALVGGRYRWYWPHYHAESAKSFESFGEAMLDALRWFYQTNPEQQQS